MSIKKPWLPALGLILLLALSACLPRMQQPAPPQAQVQNFQLISLDPFTGRADFQLDLKISNPNAFDLPLLESTLTLYFDDASIPFDLPEMTIRAAGFEVVPTRISVPLAEATAGLAKLLRGGPVRLRISGRSKVNVGPLPINIGPYTLLDQTVRLELSFAMPTFKLLPGQSSLSLSGGTLEVAVAFQVTNTNPIGFYLRGPVALVIGGRQVASAGLDVPLRPRQSSTGRLVFRLGLSEVPGAAAGLVAGLQLEVRGGLKAEIPGLWQQGLELLMGGRVR